MRKSNCCLSILEPGKVISLGHSRMSLTKSDKGCSNLVISLLELRHLSAMVALVIILAKALSVI